MNQSILIVDDDKSLLSSLRSALLTYEYDVSIADGGPSGLEQLDAQTFDLLLVDLGMPEVDGFSVMSHALRHGRARSVIVMTGQNSVPVAVEAMNAGAADFLTKPFEFENLRSAIQKALNRGIDPEDEFQKWRQRHAPELIGQDPALLSVLEMVKRVAPTECEVLITGESGTGKELIAQTLHRASDRSRRPFVAVNCAAIPKELMESEVFGHAKGAFTGASERRVGKFQAADGGTLFLDEIGELDLSIQSKFLRVLQEKEFTPVGESRSRKADVRIISATNQDLRTRCKDGKFREDLYFRLNVIPFHLSPLRDRPSDIPILLDYFVTSANQRHGRNVTGIDVLALKTLEAYSWPGNTREMKNLLERIVVLKSEKGPITPRDLPDFLQQPSPPSLVNIKLPDAGLDLTKALQKVEQQLTLDALRRSGGNKAKAAALLGLKRTTLIERLKKFEASNTGDL